jgi:cardiolipin synthase C
MFTLCLRMNCLLLALLLAALAAGCAGLPANVERVPSSTRVAAADAPLPMLVQQLEVPPGLSAVRPMPMPQHALATRLALMAQASTSLDVQTYLLADDATGRLILRALLDAAERGVRVRLLLDDFYTQGLDGLLVGLAAHTNAEVRLFNPFAYGRDAAPARLWQLATDFERLNHRMHNKLFVADGVMAVVGGRNLADEYFLRGADSNFIDFELLAAGAVVPELSAGFDGYWNSERVFPLHAIVSSGPGAAQTRARFEQLNAEQQPVDVPGLADGSPEAVLRPPHQAIGNGLFGFFIAPAAAHADPPIKAAAPPDDPRSDTVAARLLRQLAQAQSEVVLVSPYFVPGDSGMQRMKQLRERGVSLRVVTNATGTSDEPIVSLGYENRRSEMLRMGVRLYEVSSGRLKRDQRLRSVLGSSTGRLHAKIGFIDRETFVLGSLNLDARSAMINTELGLLVRSPELTRQMMDYYQADTAPGVYEVRLRNGGDNLEWVAHEGDGEERLDEEPESSWLLRLKLRLMSLFVREDLL